MAYHVALVTDSTCDIPAEWKKQYDIRLVPLTIIFGEQQYLDGVDLSAEQFYERLVLDPHHPTTSQPTPQAFLNAYHEAAANGAEQILVVTISSAMSGTIESARQVAQKSPIPVETVDGCNNSMGLGWQVIAAAKAREAGGDLKAMLAAMQPVRQDMAYYVSLDTIDYLSRGGRISEADKFLNSVLKIKPLIYVRPEDGKVAPSIPARSRKSALEGLYNEFFNHLRKDRPMHIAVLYTNVLLEAQELAEKIRREYSPKELFLVVASPALGVHAGPGAIALCGYAER
jgi:DegV family protein with EDD domain